VLWPLFFFAVSVAHAKEVAPQWSVSPVLGVHAPALSLLNNEAFKSPLRITAQVMDEFGEMKSRRVSFRTPLPEIGAGAEAGLDIQWNISESLGLFVGYGTWEGESSAQTVGEFPLEGALDNAVNERSVRLSYNQAYLGIRYAFLQKPRKYRTYARFSLHNIFDFDYREDQVFTFLTGGATGFKRIIITKAHATAIILAQTGLGFDYFIKDWFSIGFEAGYVIGLSTFELSRATREDDFLGTDGIGSVRLPLAVPNRDGVLHYLDASGPVEADGTKPDDSTYRSMSLGLDGWKAAFRISIEY